MGGFKHSRRIIQGAGSKGSKQIEVQPFNPDGPFDSVSFLRKMKKKSSSRKRPSVAPIIPAFTLAAKIKRKLRAHLKALGFSKDKEGALLPPSDGKDVYRSIHQMHRQQKLSENSSFLEPSWEKYEQYFANGSEVDPYKIEASLELVESESWQGELFRLASLTWSVPVSAGYGRRMRFLVWDKSNGKLMGLIALADPVYNLSARDSEIGWSLANTSCGEAAPTQ